MGIGSVLVLEAEEGSASSEIHLLDLVSGLGSTESHEGVDVRVVSSGQEGEEVVVSEGVHEIPVPLVVASEDLGKSLGQRGFDLDLFSVSDVSEVGDGRIDGFFGCLLDGDGPLSSFGILFNGVVHEDGLHGDVLGDFDGLSAIEYELNSASFNHSY